MIIINNLSIDSTAENLLVDVTTDMGNVFTSIHLWTIDTFKDATTFIDLSSYIAGTSENENLTIPASALGLTRIMGLYFIEFTTNETVTVTDCCIDNMRLAVVSNFIKYHECILNRLVNLEIDNCSIKDLDCKPQESVLYIQSLLDGLYLALESGFYQEAITLIKKLDIFCTECTACLELGENLISSTGYGIQNNVLTIL